MIYRIYKYLSETFQLVRDPTSYARNIGVRVGENCRLIDVNRKTFGSEPYLISIGDHVTITSGVKFLTHDGGVWIFREKNPEIEIIAPIIIENNVFVGVNTIILPGITIGENSIVGAGSVVTKDVPSNTVSAGVPVRTIKSTTAYYNDLKENIFLNKSMQPSEKEKYYRKHFSM